MKDKIHLLGINMKTGSTFDIELKNKKDFSRECLRDMLLYPKENPHEIKNIVKENRGAHDFFSWVARELEAGAKEFDNEIEELEKAILKRRR